MDKYGLPENFLGDISKEIGGIFGKEDENNENINSPVEKYSPNTHPFEGKSNNFMNDYFGQLNEENEQEIKVGKKRKRENEEVGNKKKRRKKEERSNQI